MSLNGGIGNSIGRDKIGLASPTQPKIGSFTCPRSAIPGMRDLLRSWPPARALMRLMSWLDIEQTGVMLLG